MSLRIKPSSTPSATTMSTDAFKKLQEDHKAKSLSKIAEKKSASAVASSKSQASASEEWDRLEAFQNWNDMHKDLKPTFLHIAKGTSVNTSSPAIKRVVQTLLDKKLIAEKQDGLHTVLQLTDLGKRVYAASSNPNSVPASTASAARNGHGAPTGPSGPAEPTPPVPAKRPTQRGQTATLSTKPARSATAAATPSPPDNRPTALDIAKASLRIKEAKLRYAELDVRRHYLSDVAKSKLRNAQSNYNQAKKIVESLEKG